MTKKHILSLDLGTTGNRVIVFDKKCRIVYQAYREFPQIFPKPGWVEHNPERIWQDVKKLLKKTFQKIPPKSIAAMGITNQRETVLLWDKKTGKPLHNAIVWQCRRTSPFCEQLKEKGLAAEIHKRSGLFVDAYFSASKLTWLLKHLPDIRKKAKSGRVLAGTIDSWILWKLTGGRVHATDSSNASRTMLFNIHSKKWDKWLCRQFQVPVNILPKVVPSSAHIGFLDKGIAGEEIPITGVIGDQQAASFAQGCFAPGIIKNTYGTGLFLLENTKKKTHSSKNLLTTIAWSLGDLKHTEYTLEGSIFIGGAAIQWLRDGLKLFKNAKESQKMAQGISSNEGVYFVPALVGLGAPYWDPSARGTILGLTRGSHAAHMARAALESIAYQTRDILEVMKKDARKTFKILRVDGGASVNDFLMQFQADILGIRVERPKVLETTALGAAGVAGLAVGFWKNQKEFGNCRRVDKVFRPRMKRAQADQFYSQWKEAVNRARGWVK